MHRDEEQQETGMEIRADTPIGKLAAKGMRVSDLIALATFAVTVVIAIILAQHQTDSNLASAHFVSAIREAATAQRMQTCIMSIPQEKREQEYMAPNGFCKQMSMIQ